MAKLSQAVLITNYVAKRPIRLGADEIVNGNRYCLRILEGIANLDHKIEEATGAHPELFIFQSLPGAGVALAPRLLAAFGSQRDRYDSADEVQKHCGIAPVTEASGEKKWVHFRWACAKFLRQSFHEWAGHTIGYSVWARAFTSNSASGATITTLR